MTEAVVREKSQAILAELGLDMTTAINLFLRQVVRYRGIPFELRVPNAETIAAIEEAKQEIDLHKCDSLEQMFRELNED